MVCPLTVGYLHKMSTYHGDLLLFSSDLDPVRYELVCCVNRTLPQNGKQLMVGGPSHGPCPHDNLVSVLCSFDQHGAPLPVAVGLMIGTNVVERGWQYMTVTRQHKSLTYNSQYCNATVLYVCYTMWMGP